jgi:para-nitrobenzyl esterase
MKAAERRSAPGFAPAYLYYWTWESPLEGGKYRAQHTIDIAFAFDNVKASRLTAGAPDAQALADRVSEAFIAFFRTGDPNTPKSKLPAWPRFDSFSRPTMVFDGTPELRNDPLREQRPRCGETSASFRRVAPAQSPRPNRSSCGCRPPDNCIGGNRGAE